MINAVYIPLAWHMLMLQRVGKRKAARRARIPKCISRTYRRF
jgi:hypothetical protein